MQTIARFALALTVATVALLAPAAHAQEIEGYWKVEQTGEAVQFTADSPLAIYHGTVTLTVSSWGGNPVDPVTVVATLYPVTFTNDLNYRFKYSWSATSRDQNTGQPVSMYDNGTGVLTPDSSTGLANRLTGYWQSDVWTNSFGRKLSSPWNLVRLTQKSDAGGSGAGSGGDSSGWDDGSGDNPGDWIG